jgi:hypothetical protein
MILLRHEGACLTLLAPRARVRRGDPRRSNASDGFTVGADLVSKILLAQRVLPGLVRIVMAEIPRMIGDIVHETVADDADMLVVGEYSERTACRKAVAAEPPILLSLARPSLATRAGNPALSHLTPHQGPNARNQRSECSAVRAAAPHHHARGRVATAVACSDSKPAGDALSLWRHSACRPNLAGLSPA